MTESPRRAEGGGILRAVDLSTLAAGLAVVLTAVAVGRRLAQR